MMSHDLEIETRRAIHHLLWIWHQYGNPTTFGEPTTHMELSHSCMKAGEDAADFLERLGLGEDVGDTFVVNEAGLLIMYDDTLEER